MLCPENLVARPEIWYYQKKGKVLTKTGSAVRNP